MPIKKKDPLAVISVNLNNFSQIICRKLNTNITKIA